MRRRSRGGGKSPNAQAPKAVARKSRIARKAVRRRSFAGTHETELARVIRERDEAREQQTATADVLKIISRSTFDLKEVLNTLTESAARLCAGDKGIIFQLDGDVLRLIANLGHSREAERYWLEHPMPIDGGSATGRAVLEGRAIHIPDVLADPKYRATRYQELSGYRSVLCVPLLRDGTTIGTFSLSRDAVTPFTDRQIKLVETFADQAVIAIENTRLFEAEQQRTRELTESLEQQTATSQVLQVISSSPGDLQPVFASMLENAVRICDAAFGNIYRWDGSAMRLVAAHNTPPAFAEARRRSDLSGPKTAMGRMVATNAVVHVIDAAADEAYFERDASYVEAVELGGVRTLLVVPLLKDNALMGAFTVYRQEVRPFAAKQIELVQNFAAQAVIAIENARLLSELRQRTTDLTERTADLTELLEQQTATSEVLGVISRSKFELQPILQSVVDTASQLCRADVSVIFRLEGGVYRFAAGYSLDPAYLEHERRTPISPGPGTVVGRAAMSREVVQIEDAWTDPLYEQKAAVKISGGRSMIGVPLMREGEPIGVIGLARTRVEHFTQREIELVTTFADQAVIAIENVRLFEAEQQRTRELTESLEQQTATSEVLKAISSSPGDLEPVFAAMLENAVRISDSKFGNIYRWQDDALHLVAAHKTPPALIEARRRSPLRLAQNPVVGRMIATNTTIHVTDATTLPEYIDRSDPASVALVELGGVRTALAVPMLSENELIGSFTVCRQEVRPFTDKQIELIENFANQAVIAIENTRLLRELRESLQQQTATADVLKVISRSTFDLQTVLQTLVELSCSALRCRQDYYHPPEKWSFLPRRSIRLFSRFHRLCSKYSDPAGTRLCVRARTARRACGAYPRRKG